MTLNKLKLKLLGNVQIFFNDEEITSLLSGKSTVLLIYLAFYRKTKHKRSKITELLWGNTQDHSAKYNMRYNLWAINKIVKDYSLEKIIETSASELYINPVLDIELDTDYLIELEKELGKGNYNADELLLKKEEYKELFLDGIYLKECFEFNDWVYNKREEFQKIYTLIIKALLKDFQINGKVNSSIKLLKELINLNPYNEDNYIEIIKEFLNIQDKKNALMYYNKCINIFREELNISPTEYLLEWGERIKKSTAPKNIQSHNIAIFLKNKAEDNSLVIECFPCRIEYSFLYELSEILMKKCHVKNKNILRDISCINPSILCENVQIPQKIRLFNSFIILLNEISGEEGVSLEIRNFHFIDKSSFEFFKYLVFSNKVKGSIYLTNTIKCEELAEIEKYMTVFK